MCLPLNRVQEVFPENEHMREQRLEVDNLNRQFLEEGRRLRLPAPAETARHNAAAINLFPGWEADDDRISSLPKTLTKKKQKNGQTAATRCTLRIDGVDLVLRFDGGSGNSSAAGNHSRVSEAQTAAEAFCIRQHIMAPACSHSIMAHCRPDLPAMSAKLDPVAMRIAELASRGQTLTCSEFEDMTWSLSRCAEGKRCDNDNDNDASSSCRSPPPRPSTAHSQPPLPPPTPQNILLIGMTSLATHDRLAALYESWLRDVPRANVWFCSDFGAGPDPREFEQHANSTFGESKRDSHSRLPRCLRKHAAAILERMGADLQYVQFFDDDGFVSMYALRRFLARAARFTYDRSWPPPPSTSSSASPSQGNQPQAEVPQKFSQPAIDGLLIPPRGLPYLPVAFGRVYPWYKWHSDGAGNHDFITAGPLLTREAFVRLAQHIFTSVCPSPPSWEPDFVGERTAVEVFLSSCLLATGTLLVHCAGLFHHIPPHLPVGSKEVLAIANKYFKEQDSEGAATSGSERGGSGSSDFLRRVAAINLYDYEEAVLINGFVGNAALDVVAARIRSRRERMAVGRAWETGPAFRAGDRSAVVY